MPTGGGPLILPQGGTRQGRADTGFGTAYSLNLGSIDGLWDHVAPHNYEDVKQNVDLTGVDAITFRLGLKGAAAIARPSDLVALGHFDGPPTFTTGAWDLSYCRDGGSVTGTASGSPAIYNAGKFGPCLRLDAVENIQWSGAGIVDSVVQTGCVSIWIRPGYSGAPGTIQSFYYSADLVTSTANRVWIFHHTNGNLVFYVSDYLGTGLIVNISAAWSPTSGTWYHIEENFNVTAGASRQFVNGSQMGSTDTGTGTRTGDSEGMAIGRNSGSVVAQNFDADELQVYDAVQRTEDFDVPEAALPENYWLFRVIIGSAAVAYEEKIYADTDAEYPQRAVNVSQWTGAQDVRFRLMAV